MSLPSVTAMNQLMPYVQHIGRSPRLLLQLLLTLLLACVLGGAGMVGLHEAGSTVSTVTSTRVPALVHLLKAERDIEQLNYSALAAVGDSNAQRRAAVDIPAIQRLTQAAWQDFQQYQAAGARDADQAAVAARAEALFHQGLALSNVAGALNRSLTSRALSQGLLRVATTTIVTPLLKALTQLATLDEADVTRAGVATAVWAQAAAWRLLVVVVLTVLGIAMLQVGIAAREHRHRATVQQTADLVLFLDARAGIRYFSPTFERALGYPRKALEGRIALEFVHPDDRNIVQAAFVRLSELGGSPHEIEYRVRHADGTYRWFASTTANLLRDPLIRGVVVTSHDITIRKEAEAALQASEARLRAVISHAPILLFALDHEGVFTLYEGGQQFTREDIPHPTVGHSIQAWIRQVTTAPDVWERASAGEAFSTIVEVGNEMFEAWWTPTSAGALSGGTGVAVNVTERVGAQREAERARAAAEELAKLRSDFVASVSHELRTPLTAIVGYGELLQTHWGRLDDAQRRERLGRIVVAANRQKRLVDDLLQLTSMDTRCAAPIPEAVRLDSLLKRVSSEMSVTYAGQRFELYGPPDLQVLADLDHTTQIIANLLDNAAKYSPRDSSIIVAWSLEGDDVLLRVADRGAGIPQASRNQLFTRFGRIPGSRIRSGHVGTGLGLYLGRRQARAMGGDLDLEQTGPEGSTFRLRLPAVST